MTDLMDWADSFKPLLANVGLHIVSKLRVSNLFSKELVVADEEVERSTREQSSGASESESDVSNYSDDEGEWTGIQQGDTEKEKPPITSSFIALQLLP